VPSNEHGLTKEVRAYLERLKLAHRRVWGFKTSGGLYQMVGLPDWILCVNGRFVAIETKHPDGSTEANPKQGWVLAKIAAAGGLVLVARRMAEIEALVEVALASD
jgi:hypothetical protein